MCSMTDDDKSTVISTPPPSKVMFPQKRLLKEPNRFDSPVCLPDETWCQVSDESFLEMEQKCNMETTINCSQASSVNETLLFDVDPPSEFWNQTMDPSLAIQSPPENMQDSKPMVVWRPSTIIEETSSQMSSLNKGNDGSTSSKGNDSSSTAINNQNDSKKSSNSSSGRSKSSLGDVDDMFKVTKRKYKFFADENDATPTPRYRSKENTTATPLKMFELDNPASGNLITPVSVKFGTPANSNLDTPTASHLSDDSQFTPADKRHCDSRRRHDRFNDTLEAIDFFIEEGKRQEDSKSNVSIAATPLFSCKRTKILNQFAAEQMATFPRRGPLINLMSPPRSDQSPVDKTA